MNRIGLLLFSACILSPTSFVGAASTINSTDALQSSYGANIGWVVFTNATAAGSLPADQIPKFDLITGKFRGYAYGANVGWISLSNQFAQVKTYPLPPRLRCASWAKLARHPRRQVPSSNHPSANCQS